MPYLKLLLTPSDGGPYHTENLSIDLESKPMDWFPYDSDLRYERINIKFSAFCTHC